MMQINKSNQKSQKGKATRINRLEIGVQKGLRLEPTSLTTYDSPSKGSGRETIWPFKCSRPRLD